MIRPQMLTKKPVEMFIHDEVIDAFNNKSIILPPFPEDNRDYTLMPAWAAMTSYTYVHYEIHINRPRIRELFGPLLLRKNIPYAVLEAGIILHEIGHIDNGTLDIEIDEPLKSNAVLMYIYNTLADTRDENWMAYRYPGHVACIQVALSMVRYVFPVREEKGNKIHKTLHDLFQLVRFGRIASQADKKFVSFALPYVLSATSIASSVQNLFAASCAIYAYMMEEQTNENREISFEWEEACRYVSSIGVTTVIDDCDLSADTIIATDVATVAQQIDDGVPLDKIAGGSLAGYGGEVLEFESDGAFARAVQIENVNIIAALRREYMQFYEQMLQTPMFEGELSEDTDCQQALYLSSFTGDEVLSYELPEPLIPSLEQVLLCDISDSTSDVQELYARAVVIALAALEDIPGFKTALIRFNHEAKLIKGFADTMRESALDPQSSGGTRLGDALNIVSEFQWTEAVRLMFVITDGDIRDIQYATSIFDRMEREQGIYTWLIDLCEGGIISHCAGKYKHAFACSIAELPSAIADHVMGYIRGKMYGER